MKGSLKLIVHEDMYGPHFTEKCALKAVSNMHNEDGTRGAHWNMEETTLVANQYGIDFNKTHYNKCDWYVALNMVYSDYYHAVMTITNNDNVKHFVDLAKAWLEDKDVEEGKMWYYYMFIMSDELREEILENDEEADEEAYYHYATESKRDNTRLSRSKDNQVDYDVDYYRNSKPMRYKISKY